MGLVSVYTAPSELLANTVRDLLQHHGIAAQARCTDLLRTLMLPLPPPLTPAWGIVQVQPEDAELACEIIAGFFSAEAEPLADTELSK